MIRSRLAAAAALTIAALGLTGCGDDAAPSEDAEAESASAGDIDAWCLGWNSPGVPEEDGDVEGAFTAILAAEEATAEVAPPEIADANRVWVEFQRAYVDHLSASEWDLDVANATEPWTEAERAAVDEARTALDDFSLANCRSDG